MAPAAVNAADLCLRAGEGETLEIWPETERIVSQPILKSFEMAHRLLICILYAIWHLTFLFY